MLRYWYHRVTQFLGVLLFMLASNRNCTTYFTASSHLGASLEAAGTRLAAALRLAPGLFADDISLADWLHVGVPGAAGLRAGVLQAVPSRAGGQAGAALHWLSYYFVVVCTALACMLRLPSQVAAENHAGQVGGGRALECACDCSIKSKLHCQHICWHI